MTFNEILRFGVLVIWCIITRIVGEQMAYPIACRKDFNIAYWCGFLTACGCTVLTVVTGG